MTSQLSADFNKSMNPTTTEHHHPITHLHPPLPPSIPPSPPRPCICIFANTGPVFIRTYQSGSEQRGGLPQSERSGSLSQPAVQNGDRRREKKRKKGRGGGREKSLFSENTILAECLPVSDKRGKEKKKYSPSVNSGKSVLSLWLNAWVPPAFSVLAIPPLHPRLQRGTCKHIS